MTGASWDKAHWPEMILKKQCPSSFPVILYKAAKNTGFQTGGTGGEEQE